MNRLFEPKFKVGDRVVLGFSTGPVYEVTRVIMFEHVASIVCECFHVPYPVLGITGEGAKYFDELNLSPAP